MTTDEWEKHTLSSVLKIHVFIFLIDWLSPHSSLYLEVGWVDALGIRVEMKRREKISFEPRWSHFNMFQSQKDDNRKWVDQKLPRERIVCFFMTLLFDLCTPERANLWFLRPVYTPQDCVCMHLFWLSRLKISFTSTEVIIARRWVQSFTLFLTVVLDSWIVIAGQTQSLVIGLINFPKSLYLSILLFILTKQKNSFEFPHL